MHRSARTASEVIESFDQRIQQPPAPKEKDYQAQQGHENEKQNTAALCHAPSILSPSGFVVRV
jgi:hypothetical protein